MASLVLPCNASAHKPSNSYVLVFVYYLLLLFNYNLVDLILLLTGDGVNNALALR